MEVTGRILQIGNLTITRRPSIFVSRNGKQDCVISIFTPIGDKDQWGVRVDGGYRRIIARIECETGRIIHHFEGTIPSNEELKKLGMIDEVAK